MTDLPNHPVGVSLTPSFSDEGVAAHTADTPVPLADDVPSDERPDVAVATILIFAGIYAIALIALLLTKSPALT